MVELLVGCVADNQVDEGSRLAEHDRVMKFIAEDGARRGVGLWLHAGDVYEHPRGSTARERASVQAWVAEAADRAPVVLVAGNHEAPGEVAELGRLRTTFPVIAAEAPGVHVVRCRVPTLSDSLPVAVACLPWPNKGKLLAGLPPMSPKEADALAVEHLRRILLGLGWEVRKLLDEGHARAAVLVSHVEVRGSSLDNDQPSVGPGLRLDLADLALASCPFNVLGHIHKPQEWTFGEGTFVYPGSPRRTAFAAGELVPKGYVVAQMAGAAGEPLELVEWERVPTPATPLALVEAAWIGGEEESGEGLLRWSAPGGAFVYDPRTVLDDVTGAEIRFRYTVASDQRRAARDAATAWAETAGDAGALDVLLEERVLATSTARAPEIAAAPTAAEKLSKFITLRGIDVPPERLARLTSRLRGLEEGKP